MAEFDTRYLDGFIGELLHINDVADNKLIDLGAGMGAGTFILEHACADVCAYALDIISSRIGKTGNTVLINSAQSGDGQRVDTRKNTFDWKLCDGRRDVKALHAFITNARRDLIARGNNPLFLGLGALNWRIAVKEKGKETVKDVKTPIFVFPVRLIVSSKSAPVAIEFIDDEIYFNPCLIAKLAKEYGDGAAEGLPKLGGRELSLPVELKTLGDGSEYFSSLEKYFASLSEELATDNGGFAVDKGTIAIAQYNHGELCTYYDIRRNRDKVYSHPLVQRLFDGSRREADISAADFDRVPPYVLQRDSVQERIITRAVNGQSLIIKGPPGTGKTVTIANMLATLLSENKKVIFASKKISALTEVYAKLPENLRKFALLLDGETEKEAAKIQPDALKLDFKNLIADSRGHRRPTTLSADINRAEAERAKALRSLSAYATLMFGDKCIFGDSFYNALDTLCADGIPSVDFASEQAVAALMREQLNGLLSRVSEAQGVYDIMTCGNAHPVYKCPWFGIDLSCDAEGATRALSAIAAAFDGAYAKLRAPLADLGVDADRLTLSRVRNLSYAVTGKEALTALAEGDYSAEIDSLRQTLAALNEVKPAAAVTGTDYEKSREYAERLDGCRTDGALTADDIKCVAENMSALKRDGKYLTDAELVALSKLFEIVGGEQAAREEKLNLARAVFGADMSEEDTRFILSCRTAFEKYSDNCPDRPKTFDFKAKKAYAKLCEISYLSSPSFKDIVGATGNLCAAMRHDGEIAAVRERINKLYSRRLTDGEYDCVRLVTDRCLKGHTDVCAYATALTDEAKFLAECFAHVDGGVTVDGLKVCYRAAELNAGLKLKLAKLGERVPLPEGDTDVAYAVIAAHDFLADCGQCGVGIADAIAAAEFVSERSGARDGIIAVADGLASFGRQYFRNFYSIAGGDNTFADMRIFSRQASDRDVVGAAAKYTAIKNNPSNAVNLNEFFYAFEKGEKLPDGVDFARAFEYNAVRIAVAAKNRELGILRNGMGNNADSALGALAAADARLCALNAQDIGDKCLARINPDDSDLTFVQDRNPNENLRLMFKRNAHALLKLKRLFILSPYTASLLFNNEEFEDFDVLIIDEASQLEPALALPVLFRSKQCIIVGDEWQMPPIKHFTALGIRREGEEDGYDSLEAEISVLGLALRGAGFPVEELICHYRSRTETLIKFSQESFYPNMRTFPSPEPSVLPKKGVPGLGMKDVFVEGGIVTLGRNEAEAARVVGELKLHFDNYYDGESKTLSMSVGVIAFGEAQCSLIREKVNADKALKGKIDNALKNFDDLPEKLIFFKTIETVQGQEMGHIILSLTHGRREGGLNMSFGQLNQGKLGKCVFNVAVTRAQRMITVVHSVRSYEVTGESVGYIRDYLRTVEMFDGGKCEGQFVCEKPAGGFFGSVAKVMESCGFDKKRIVYNYGVTHGSVKIPLVLLDSSLQRALLGVWCERPTDGKYDFVDYNMRYKNSLENCGWKLHTVYIHDWVDNYASERAALEKVLKNIKNQEEKN